jgi:ABC-2 type transport system ATP-binding protein
MVDEATVEARDLARSFGDSFAVRGISFAVKRGEVVGFLGHNGAGKSTTMRMLAGALAPTSGSARVMGYDSASVEAKACVGFLPETPPLTAELTVEEQLQFVARLRSPKSGVELRREVDRVIERCDLGDVRRKLNATLSKGTKQRVGLAQALLQDPAVLLLDEPTAGLDPKQAAATRALIRELGTDRAVLMSTHLLHEVTALCSRALLVRRGELVVDATVAELRAQGPSLEATVLGLLEGSAARNPEARA